MMPDEQHSIDAEVLMQLRGKDDRERLLHRLHSVVLVLRGLPFRTVAALYGDAPRALAYWVKWYREKGVEGLKDDKSPGRPPRLSAAQMEEVHAFVTKRRENETPLNAQTVSLHIKKVHGISVSVRQSWRIIRKCEK